MSRAGGAGAVTRSIPLDLPKNLLMRYKKMQPGDQNNRFAEEHENLGGYGVTPSDQH